MNRQLIVSATAALLLGSAALACRAPAQGPTLGVGDVINGNAAVIVTSGTVGAPITVQISTDDAFNGIVFSQVVQQDNPLVPAKLFVPGLQPNTRYFARATAEGQSRTSTFVSRATTIGARVPTTPGTRFGVSGDWRGDIGLFNGILNADERQLDFFVKLGDTVYADVPSPAVPSGPAQTLDEFRAKHVKNYAPSYGIDPWGDLASSTQTFALIDDHEVTNDFDGGAYSPATGWFNQSSLYVNGVQAFTEHNPMFPAFFPALGDPRVDGRPLLYRSFQWGSDAAAFILDTRSFRDASLTPVSNPFDPAQVQAFIIASFNPARTMLGHPQLGLLLNDLSAAQLAGVTWKFVMTPEPIQNFGPLAAEDRWEGFAAERAYLLSQIVARGITNVVFVTADFHGTIVNDVTVPNPGNPAQQLFTGMFEIVTGSVAYSAPAGPTFAQLGVSTGAISDAQYAYYQSMPNPAKDVFVQQLLDTVVGGYGYSPTGIQNPSIQATFTVGVPVAAHHYGWTEFEVNAETKALTLTTYGVDWYSPAEVLADPAGILARPITVRQQFTVQANMPNCAEDLNGDHIVSGPDLGALLSEWGDCDGTCAADLNNDGMVDGDDLGLLLGAWGGC